MDLPAGTDLYDGKVYEKAMENLSKMEENGILVQDNKPLLLHIRTGTQGQGADWNCRLRFH